MTITDYHTYLVLTDFRRGVLRQVRELLDDFKFFITLTVQASVAMLPHFSHHVSHTVKKTKIFYKN